MEDDSPEQQWKVAVERARRHHEHRCHTIRQDFKFMMILLGMAVLLALLLGLAGCKRPTADPELREHVDLPLFR